MWLVLCEANDAAAHWAYQGLKARNLEPLELVSAEMLAYGVNWEHRLGIDGVHVDITLPNGRRIRSEHVRGVLNRLWAVPAESLLLIHPSDRNYVKHELTTFFLSWLYALPDPMLNRPTPQGLSGYARHISEWIWLAAQAGLPTVDYVYTGNTYGNELGSKRRLAVPGTQVNTVFVINGYVTGTCVPPELQQGCIRLAHLARTALLGIEFAVDVEGRWTFIDSTPFPDLRLGGQALLDILVLVMLNALKQHP